MPPAILGLAGEEESEERRRRRVEGQA